MRTTVEFDEESTAAIERLRREEGLGVSEAVNALVHRGLVERDRPVPFRQKTRALGIRVDVSSVADALEALEGPLNR
jgi:hypothetical protein